MKDEYVSVEHIMLGLIIKASNSVSAIFSNHSVTKDAFLKALLSVRAGFAVR